MIDTRRRRRWFNLGGVVIVVGLMSYALFAEYVQGFEPCPLCIFQRIAMVAVGVVFLIAALHAPLGWGARVYAALGVLTARAGRRGIGLGLRWGVGHSAGLVAVGALALLLREALDFDPLAGWGEPLVGAALILVGLRALVTDPHAHPHPAESGGTALLFGTLHGPAGASHVWATLPALALPTTAQAVAYVLSRERVGGL